jgi:hypothetical protein
MADLLGLIWGATMGFFQQRLNPEAEIVALRHLFGMLRRKRPEKLIFITILRVCAMGIRDRSTAPRFPWQNGHCERLIGWIRREGFIMLESSFRQAQ